MSAFTGGGAFARGGAFSGRGGLAGLGLGSLKGGGVSPPPSGFSFVTTNNGAERVTSGGEPVYARNT